MGYFSWECRECAQSLKAPDADCEAWEGDGVAVLPSGSLLKGRYDGFGRLCDSGITLEVGDVPDIYHRRCWDKAGYPSEYKGGSPAAGDQGFFGHEPTEDDPDECRECGCELDPDWDIDDICEDREAAEAEGDDEVCPNCYADYDLDGECDCDDE